MPSNFIRPMHPKTEVLPTTQAIRKILNLQWIGQPKINGHRVQIHLSADRSEKVITYNRQGREHKKLLPKHVEEELRRLLPLNQGWTVLDAEWVKKDDQIFLFDVLKLNDERQDSLPYIQRWQLLPQVYQSPCVTTLPVLRTVEQCLAVLEDENPLYEGLVFRSAMSPGFKDTAIVRCRKPEMRN